MLCETFVWDPRPLEEIMRNLELVNGLWYYMKWNISCFCWIQPVFVTYLTCIFFCPLFFVFWSNLLISTCSYVLVVNYIRSLKIFWVYSNSAELGCLQNWQFHFFSSYPFSSSFPFFDTPWGLLFVWLSPVRSLCLCYERLQGAFLNISL